MMLTNVTTVPADLTQETSLNSKYVKGIPTAVTDPDVDIGNVTHTHTSDGDHSHTGLPVAALTRVNSFTALAVVVKISNSFPFESKIFGIF